MRLLNSAGLQLPLDEDYQDRVRTGRVPGVTGWTKFGYRAGLLAASGEETIWATSGNFTPQTAAETWTVTYNNATDGAGTDGALTLAVYYIDASGEEAVALHTLGNDGSDTTSFSGFGINRCAVSTSGADGVNASDITFTGTTSGLKAAVVTASNGVTEQAVFTMGANHIGVAKYLWLNVGKGAGGGSPKVLIKGYAFNRTPAATTYEIFRALIDTSVDLTIDLSDPIGFNFSPSDVVYFTADTDTNGADIAMRFSLNTYNRAYF